MTQIHLEGGIVLTVSNPTTQSGVRARINEALAAEAKYLVDYSDENGENVSIDPDRVVAVLPAAKPAVRKRRSNAAAKRKPAERKTSTKRTVKAVA
jgi:hypothetical protein